MKLECGNAVLYIHPEKPASNEPLMDELTLKFQTLYKREISDSKTAVIGHMAEDVGELCRAGVLQCTQPCESHKKTPQFVPDLTTNGWHACTAPGCKNVLSAAHDYRLSNGIAVNTLALHYLMHHRSEIPEHDLALLAKMIREPDDSTQE